VNAYEAKQEARRERLEAAAEKAQSRASQHFATADKMASVIPFGQPILVGHHSERADRNYRGRIHGHMDKGCAESKKAEYYEQRAASVGKGGISSDDPDAVTKLRAELEKLEKMQDTMKRANVCVRKKDRAGLAALGFNEARVEQLFTPDFCGRLGFPGYAVTNNNANIRRIRERIADLEKRAEQPEREPITGPGFTVREDRDENRVCIEFDAIPAPEIRAELKRAGFKWSPTRGAWVRMASNGAWWHAEQITAKLVPVEPEKPAEVVGMVAHIYSNGMHTRLRVSVTDLEELIVRRGWTIVNAIEGMTDEARAEVDRLRALEYVEGMSTSDQFAVIDWWRSRLISAEPCGVTPDM
jgi:hypothetical protein